MPRGVLTGDLPPPWGPSEDECGRLRCARDDVRSPRLSLVFVRIGSAVDGCRVSCAADVRVDGSSFSAASAAAASAFAPARFHDCTARGALRDGYTIAPCPGSPRDISATYDVRSSTLKDASKFRNEEGWDPPAPMLPPPADFLAALTKQSHGSALP